uniref:Protein FAR1-RELATED SEQUENCE n=1 Tax=Lactuca sativa TaxID=4236 RepID=A0A9R1VFQ7_LACSA|nr:hypothetical protein LSAT_V11C500249190 [Lactuca sativa]
MESESSNSRSESYYSNITEESDYKPDVPPEIVPDVNNVIKSLNLAVNMNTDYAEMTSMGDKDKLKPCDTLATSFVKRKPHSNKIIIGCTAKTIFENVFGTNNYKVMQFFELHNHLLESIKDRPYMKKVRKMSYFEKIVEHHNKPIIVGAGLLSRETIEPYEWLLIAFLRAHEGKE